ncbi:MAG: tail fiber domain-containing protein, partial [Bdellovibrionota bacterium]
YDTSLAVGVGSKIESIAEDAGAAFSLKFSARDNSGYYGVINLNSSGAVGFWDATPVANTLAMDSANARSILMTRHPTNNTAGNDLTVQAGGTGGSSTNKNGGNLNLSSGIATGNGGSDIVFSSVTASQGTGTTDRSPAEVMRIKDGNVGIGVAGPTSLLHLKKTGTAGTTVEMLKLEGEGEPTIRLRSADNSGTPAGLNPLLITYRSRGTLASPAVVLSGDTAFEHYMMGHDGTTDKQLAYMSAIVDGTPGTNDMPGRLEFHTSPDGNGTTLEGTTPEMVIKNTGFIGIGTSTPSELLEIRKDQAASNTRFSINNANAAMGTTLAFKQDTVRNALVYYDNATDIFHVANENGGTGGPIHFGASGASDASEMVLLANGNVGIGNTAPAKLLHVGSASVGTGVAVANFQNVDGTCTITPASSGSGIACSSDERLKENFQDVTGAFALDRILQLQAVTYNFKTSSTDNRRTGYKAQEVQKVAPEFVRENEDGLLQVYYDAFIPWITEAIKTLYSRITDVENHQAVQDRQIASKAGKTEVEQLKIENTAKDKKIKELEQRLEKIEKALNSK